MEEIALRGEAEHHVDVGKTEVGVKKHDAFARRSEAAGEVHGEVRLAHSPLAGGDGKDQWQFSVHRQLHYG